MSSEKDTYVRRRAFNKIHVTSWLIYLEKDGFVRCPFQNCNFMAFDVNEMCEHYGFCKGDSSFAKYVCEFCKGCTVSDKRLQEHRASAHNIVLPAEDASTSSEVDAAEPGKPSRVLMLSWGFFFDKNHYIKCPTCSYVANTMSEMCRHHLVCKQERKLLLYVCPECKGRTYDVSLLIQHLERAHKISKRPDQFNHISKNMVQFWEKELRDGKYATCLHINNDKKRDCHFIDLDILGINEHSQTCKGPQHLTSARQWFCDFCPKWTNSDEKLIRHLQLTHNQSDITEICYEQKHQICDSKGEVVIVKQEGDNHLAANTVPKQSRLQSDFVALRNIEATGFKRDPSKLVKPFEMVLVSPQSNAKEPQKWHNCIKEPPKNNPQSKSYLKGVRPVSLTSNSALNKLVQKDVAETTQQSVIANTSGNSMEKECSGQTHQEIFLDLVDDKLVARMNENGIESREDNVNNTSKEKDESQDNVLSSYQPKIYKSLANKSEERKKIDKKYKQDKTFNISDSEHELRTRINESKTTENRNLDHCEPAVVDCEEKSNFEGGGVIQGAGIYEDECVITSGCDLGTDSILPHAERSERTLVEEHKVCQDLYQDELEIVDHEHKASTAVKDKDSEISKDVKKSSYGLFKDDVSSDEDDRSGEKYGDDIKLCSDWPSDIKVYHNKSPNYQRRKSNESLERFSPPKSGSSLCRQESHSEAGKSSMDLTEEKVLTISSYKGKRSYGSQYKTQLQTKNDLIVHKWSSNFGDLQEESKNSEKNDKLMLCEKLLEHKKESSSLQYQNNKKSFRKEPVTRKSDTECLNQDNSHSDIVYDESEKATDFEDKTQSGSLGEMSLSYSNTILRENCGLRSFGKLSHSKSNSVNSGGEVNEIEIDESCKEVKNSSLNVVSNRDEENKNKDYVDLTGDNPQGPYNNTEYSSKHLPSDSVCSKMSTDNEAMCTEENLSESSVSKLVSFFYHGKLNKPLLNSNSNNKSTESPNNSGSNEPSSSGQVCDGLSSVKGQNIPQNTSENENDLITQIKTDFLLDYSSDEESSVNKISVKSNEDPVKIATISNVEPENTSKDLERKLENRRISSDFFEESSFDEEDFLGTDEEVDMKDHFFNGFQEISENIQSKNRRFHQFLNRLSESENEEWYINAGNLSMDVRQDIGFVHKKTVKIKKNYEYDSLRNLDENMTVIIVNEESDKKYACLTPPQECNTNAKDINALCVRNLKSSVNQNGAIHNSYIRKNKTVKDRLNNQMETKMEKVDHVNHLMDKDLVTVHSSNENNMSSCSSDSKPMETHEISLSSDCAFETDSVQLTEKNRDQETVEVLNPIADYYSPTTPLDKKEINNTVRENNVAVNDMTDEKTVKKQSSTKGGTRNESFSEIERNDSGDTTTPHRLGSVVENPSRHHCVGVIVQNNSNKAIMDYTSVPFRKRNQIQTEINCDTVNIEININDKKKSPSTQIKKSETEGTKDVRLVQAIEKVKGEVEDRKNNSSSAESEYDDELLTTKTHQTPGQIVCSTPLKPNEGTSEENIEVKTPVTGKSSLLLGQNSRFDDTTYSDDEPLSIIQKTNQSRVQAVHGTKDNLLTDGFSPHNHIQGNSLGLEKSEEEMSSDANTASCMIERGKKDGDKSENMETAESRSSSETTNKRGWLFKRDKNMLKTEVKPGDIDVDGKRRGKQLQNLSSTIDSNQNTTPSTTTLKSGENLTSSGSKQVVDCDNDKNTESPSLVKKRGRPPKRKENQTTPEKLQTLSSTNDSNQNTKPSTTTPLTSGELNLTLSGSKHVVDCDNEKYPNSPPPIKKRGRPPKRKENLIIPEKLQNLSSTNDSNQNITSSTTTLKYRGLNLTSSGSNDLVNCDNIKHQNSPPPVKKRGRPPKRKESETSAVPDQRADPDSFYESVCENELLLSVYSEEVENILIGSSKTMPSECQSDVERPEVITVGSEEKSAQKQSSFTNNTQFSNVNEIKVPKKRGRKPKLKLESASSELENPAGNIQTVDRNLNESECSDFVNHSAIEKSSNKEVNIPKKRGRPPKRKENQMTATDSISPITQGEVTMANEINETIVSCSKVQEEVTLPKKRGRKPGSKIKRDSIDRQQSPSLENVINEIPDKRARRSRVFTKLKEEGNIKSDRNLNLSVSRRAKVEKLKTEINDTASEVSSVSALSVIDGDCNGSVRSELLDTDVIYINEEKLNSSKRSRKCKAKALKKLKIEDSDGYSDGSAADNSFGSDDTDEDASYERPQQRKKSKKIEVDENDSGSDDGETDKQAAKKGNRKIGVNYCDSIFFAIKHRQSDKVVCGVCKETMSYSSYKSHAMLKHYLLTWIEGEESPVDMTNKKDIESRLWYCKKRMGKTPFRCPSCNLPKLSAVGFYSHIQFCGKDNKEKESLLVTCEICGVRLMPSSLRPHMYIKHMAPDAGSKAEQLDQSLIVKGRRAAAARAVAVIQKSQTDDQDLEEPDSRPGTPEKNLQCLYLGPSKSVPPHEYRRWKESLAKTNSVACTLPGCDFTANNTVGFRKHYVTCPFAPPRLYRCRVCSFTSSGEKEMQEHVEEKHHDELNQSLGSEDESSDDSEGEPKTPRTAHFSLSKLPFQFLKVFQRQNKGRHRTRAKFFSLALTWTLKLRQTMFAKDMVFPGALPDYQPLPAEISSPYLPELTESIRFRGSDQQWQTLPRFTGCLVDGVAMLFAGGPVWAMAWAPVPDPQEHQYLAVAPHSSIETTHEMAAIYNYPGLIQVWSLGPLDNTVGVSQSPRLVVGLSHRRGPVWGLSWCPAGAYSQERLGLLAAACGDGSVVVYAVPKVKQEFDDPPSCSVSAKPVWDLKLGCEMLVQCTCVDWHMAEPHKIIMGGFANGMVALWDLTTTSPLLKNGTTLLPFKVIEAHHSAVTAVRMSCTKEDIYMMTASLDRATKFWRLDDCAAQVNYLRKASVTDAVMANNWLLSASAYDDVYSINNSHVTSCSYRDTFAPVNTNFTRQPGTVWGLSFNDWLNGCACASEMGKVKAFFRQQLIVTEDPKKVSRTAFTEEMVSCSARSIRDGSLVTSGFGPMYNDCASSIGLEFSFGESAKQTKTTCSSNNMDSFPLRSFNKVSWNPNVTSFTWLAAGMQCGLVVVPRLDNVHSDDLAELYKHKDNR